MIIYCSKIVRRDIGHDHISGDILYLPDRLNVSSALANHQG